MSTITNEPILLDSTGRDLLNEMKIQSGHLAMIAEGNRVQVYSSMRQIADLVRGGDVARNQKNFPIGDQIIMPWKDMDDTNHNTDETRKNLFL